MVNKYKFTRPEPGGQSERDDSPRLTVGHGRCVVHGCPRDGHSFNGVWNCRYHDNVAGSRLAQVTLLLRNHEAEINWYEKLLTASHVDFDVGAVARDAPNGMRVEDGEGLVAYRNRITLHIKNLLADKSPVNQKGVSDEKVSNENSGANRAHEAERPWWIDPA